MARAVALFSGGLDSTLAILVLMRQGIEVTAVTFLTHFGCDISDRSSCSKNPFSPAEKFGFEVKLYHLADKFIEIVKNPKFGHGKNMNPCIDCRILMLKEAKELMHMIDADFIATGEVLGQRPMSQRRDTFPLIDREAGLEGYALRPLSARLLKPTIPEQLGVVDRDRLYGFSGRSRKPQIALAKEFGLTDYPNPAGGCLLTDPIYSYRLKELLTYNKDPEFKDINLLKIGRHFRVSPECRVIVGRDKKENETLLSLTGMEDYILKVEGYGSPITIITGSAKEEALRLAASLCARYSDAKYLPFVNVSVSRDGFKYTIVANPLDEALLNRYRIQPVESKKMGKKIHLLSFQSPSS